MEVYFADRIVEVDEKALRKAQAAWRGAVVRKQMKSLRKTFENIYTDIENGTGGDPWCNGHLKNIWTDSSVLCRRSRHLEQLNSSNTVTSHSDQADTEEISNSVTNTEAHLCEAEDNNDSVSLSKQTVIEEDTSTNSPQYSSTQDPSKTVNETSVWDSIDVTQQRSGDVDVDDERRLVVMEIMWVQQAINSRKQYLRLKKDMA